MSSPKQTAHIAGALYLVVVLCGLFSLMYVPSQLSDWDNPEAMISNIASNELLFRLGIFVSIVGYIFFLLLPLQLYKLLSGINKTHAILMVAFCSGKCACFPRQHVEQIQCVNASEQS